jgi:hypothetical protein
MSWREMGLRWEEAWWGGRVLGQNPDQGVLRCVRRRELACGGMSCFSWRLCVLKRPLDGVLDDGGQLSNSLTIAQTRLTRWLLKRPLFPKTRKSSRHPIVLFSFFLFFSLKVDRLSIDGTFELGNMATRTTRRSFPRPHDDIPKQHKDLFIPSRAHKQSRPPLQNPNDNRLTPSHLTSRPRHYIDCVFFGRDRSESNQMRLKGQSVVEGIEKEKELVAYASWALRRRR